VKLSMALATSLLHPLVEIAQRAERAGLHRVWTTEGFAGDGIVRAGYLLARTERIHVATGIAYAFTRAPLAVAMASADLAELSGGRFALGLGAGTRGVRTRRFDVDFDHPAPRMGEYAQLVRAALDSEGGLSFDGRFYHCEFPQYEPTQDIELRRGVPVYAAALNPVMVRAAARLSDGVALHSLALSDHYMRGTVVPAFEKAGRPSWLAAWKIAVVDTDLDRARDVVRRQLAFYFSTPSYHGILVGTGWEDAAEQMMIEAKESGYRDFERIGRLVPDEMLAAFSLTGDPDTFADAIVGEAERLAGLGVDELVLQLSAARTSESVTRIGVGLADAAGLAVDSIARLEVAHAYV
jgi:alkanesulfonate monooxygenase SsuD/methylene tetrahydromethanopterin reductase-like flavin-dependent oxidoreductase (luciferase family)